MQTASRFQAPSVMRLVLRGLQPTQPFGKTAFIQYNPILGIHNPAPKSRHTPKGLQEIYRQNDLPFGGSLMQQIGQVTGWVGH